MRSAFLGVVLLLGTQRAGAAEPAVVDPWLSPAPPAGPRAAAFGPLVEIVDPWAGSEAVAFHETEEIVDPWADYHPRIPTAVFPLLE